VHRPAFDTSVACRVLAKWSRQVRPPPRKAGRAFSFSTIFRASVGTLSPAPPRGARSLAISAQSACRGLVQNEPNFSPKRNQPAEVCARAVRADQSRPVLVLIGTEEIPNVRYRSLGRAESDSLKLRSVLSMRYGPMFGPPVTSAVDHPPMLRSLLGERGNARSRDQPTISFDTFWIRQKVPSVFQWISYLFVPLGLIARAR
jgi:hypothetical protein